MCCFVVILGLLGPRIAFLWVWLFGDRVQMAFSDNWLVPLLGVLFLPWTALVYVLCWAPTQGVSPLGWVLVAGGFVLDLLTYSSRSIDRRYRSQSAY